MTRGADRVLFLLFLGSQLAACGEVADADLASTNVMVGDDVELVQGAATYCVGIMNPPVTGVMRKGGPAESWVANQGSDFFANNDAKRAAGKRLLAHSNRESKCGSVIQSFHTALWTTSSADQPEIFHKRGSVARSFYDTNWGSYRMHIVDSHFLTDASTYNGEWYEMSLRPGNWGEYVLWSWGQADMIAERNRIWPLGWRTETIDVRHQNGVPIYNVVFREGTRNERAYFSWSVANFRAEYDRRSAEGWRIQSIDVEDNRVFAILRPGTEQETLLLNLDEDDYRTQVTALYPAGWRTRIIDN